MIRGHVSRIVFGIILVTIALGSAEAQSFGASKEKVTLMRKLPALVHLTSNSIGVKVSGGNADLARDLQSLLEAELIKDDPRLRIDDNSPSVWITCRITDFAHPQPTVTMRPNLTLAKNAPKELPYIRVTGSLTVAFQARTAGGQTVISDNVTSRYDREFDSAGNNASEGVKGTMTSAWKRVTGGASSEDLNPPTDSELRTRLELQAVHQIALHVVNTSETVDVYLAKQRGALDDGDKQALAGLWERALETFETAKPNPKPAEDAYRLYNTGVAYEALAYKAEDAKAAMKYLEEAAINYGKAIDSKPSERYFLEPQRRIEEAIAHYRRLDEQRRPVAPPPVTPATSSAALNTPARALTNAQIVSMIKSGMDEDTVEQAIRAARAVNFDLTQAGQQSLTGSGVSAGIVGAMKTRAARARTAPSSSHPSATHTAPVRSGNTSTGPK
jgi:hypothetical protein